MTSWDNWINEKAGEAERREARAIAKLDKQCHRPFCDRPATTEVALVNGQIGLRFPLCMHHYIEVHNLITGVRTLKKDENGSLDIYPQRKPSGEDT